MTYQRYENESDEELIYRVCNDKDQIGTWQDVANILNEITGNEYNESAYRKRFQAFNKMLCANQSKFENSSLLLEQLREERQLIKKEKQKLSDERTALNKKLREQARIEEDLEILRGLIQERDSEYVDVASSDSYKSDNDMIICLSDFHLGMDVSNKFGEYNSSIAKERLSEYLGKIINIKNIHNSENAYVLLLGDLINGEIHYTVQLENREMLSEQVQKAAEYISAFIYELSKHFNNVYVNGVAGNHSRTSYKDQVLRSNRLDNLIPWYMKAKLDCVKNVRFIDDDNYDSTIGKINVRGNEYWMCHGDFDSFSQSGVSSLVLMIGHKPTGIFYGHMHHCSTDSIYDVDIIRSGGFAGTGDDYCISKRINGKPSQIVCIADNDGISCTYQVKL